MLIGKSKVFGTDGVRFKVNKLDDKFLDYIILRIIVYFGLKNVFIAFDSRFSNHYCLSYISSKFLKYGVDVYFTWLCTSSAICCYFSNFYDLSLYISASHNDEQWNGFKLFFKGVKLSETMQRGIEIVDDEKVIEYIKLNKKFGKLKLIEESKILEVLKKDYFLKKFDFNEFSFEFDKFKVLFDLGNSAASCFLKDILPEYLLDKVCIVNSDLNLPINNYNSDEFYKNYDVVFRFDGDCDRVEVVVKGEYVYGDKILAFLYEFYKNKGFKIKALVTTFMSNFGFFEFCNKEKVKVYITKVGDIYLYELMKEKSLKLGAESSGHIINFFDNIVGDGVLMSLFLLKYFKFDDFKRMVSIFNYYPTLFYNIEIQEGYRLPNIIKKEIYESILKEYEGKVEAIVRKSGTENKLRVFLKSHDHKINEEKLAEILKYRVLPMLGI